MFRFLIRFTQLWKGDERLAQKGNLVEKTTAEQNNEHRPVLQSKQSASKKASPEKPQSPSTKNKNVSRETLNKATLDKAKHDIQEQEGLEHKSVRLKELYSSFRENCDFFILPLNYVNDYKGATINYSANLDIEYLNDYFDTKLEYCLYDGVAKGFKVYDHFKDEGILKDYITYLNDDYKSDYYLFFQFKSINIGDMNSISKTNNALKVIKELMEL